MSKDTDFTWCYLTKVNMTKLLRCPCGEIPDVLVIDILDNEWAFAGGVCCSEWSVNFATHSHQSDSDELIKLAVTQWNDIAGKTANNAAEKVAPRCAPPDSSFNPDWSLLEATQESLREHMALVKERDNEIVRLRGSLAEICEVYVGTEGFHANTASEAYQEGIIYKMYQIAVGSRG